MKIRGNSLNLSLVEVSRGHLGGARDENSELRVSVDRKSWDNRGQRRGERQK